MQKAKILNYLDYLPLVVFAIQLIFFIYTCATTEYILVWQHYVAIILILVNAYVFLKNRKAGVVFLGFFIVLGICRIVACKQGIENASFGFSEQMNVPIGQPFFWLWLAIHFAISFRHYNGIATKAYWKTIFTYR